MMPDNITTAVPEGDVTLDLSTSSLLPSQSPSPPSSPPPLPSSPPPPSPSSLTQEHNDPALTTKSANQSTITYPQEMPQSLPYRDSDSYTNNLRHRRWNRWGGPYTRLFEENNHDLGRYMENNIPFNGLEPIFSRSSSWPRSIFWVAWFIGMGCFFIPVLIIPTVKQYRNRSTTTDISSETAAANGLPYPIVTICPKGSGIRCDCQLWKRLACRYYNDTANDETIFHFESLTCELPLFLQAPEPDDETKDLARFCALDWNENRLDWDDDTCGTGPLTGEELYGRAITREGEVGFPYVTEEETLVYGAAVFDDSNIFFLLVELGLHPVKVNDSWIDYNFLNLEQRKICVQVRPPQMNGNENRQTRTGVTNGLQIFSNNTMESLLATADGVGFDVYVDNNHISDSLGANGRSDIDSHKIIPVSSGTVTNIGYSLQQINRLQGYGGSISRTCSNDGDSRHVCLTNTELQIVQEMCQVCSKTEYSEYFSLANNDVVPEYDAFGCSIQCFLNTSIPPVPIEICPRRCREMETVVVEHTPQTPSQYLRNYYRLFLGNSSSVVDLRIGLVSFDITVLTESAAQTLGGLVGSIGGNLNLYFGPDFMTTIAFWELFVVGVFLSWQRRRR